MDRLPKSFDADAAMDFRRPDGDRSWEYDSKRGRSAHALKQRYDFSLFGVEAVDTHWECDYVRSTVTLRLRMKCRDRDTGRPSEVFGQESWPEWVWKEMTETARDRMVFHAIQRLVMHEVEECFLVDGKRVYDPHKDER